MMKFSNVIKFILYQVIAIAFLFVIFEGLSSTTLVIYNIWQNSRQLAERAHTEYDETLGWINLPKKYIQNMYGNEIYLKTNKQRFRTNYNISQEVLANKLRIICFGDSFTMGYGVDNDHTWCHQLTLIDQRIESVNMGQGGYGIDQAYLRLSVMV